MERTPALPNLGSRARPTSFPLDGEVFGNVVEDLSPPGDVRDLQAEVAQLRDALVSRATIDQAKGMLMSRYAVDATTAFQILKRWSSVSNIQVREVAETVLEAGVRGLPAPDLPARGLEDGVLGGQLRSFARRGSHGRRD